MTFKSASDGPKDELPVAEEALKGMEESKDGD